jgi:hypothetical protein
VKGRRPAAPNGAQTRRGGTLAGRGLFGGLLASALVVGQLSWMGWVPSAVQAAGQPTITVAETRTTDITTAGNGIGDATIGEGITYRVSVTVPPTSMVNGDLVDPLGTRQTYVPNSGVVTFPDGTVFREDGSGQPLPPGFTYSSKGNTVHLTFPKTFSNSTPDR